MNLDNGFANDAGKWEAYLDGRRSLIMAYISPHDDTLQYYHFGLPKDWDIEKTYPLFFELHGAGDDNPLSGVDAKLGLTPEAMQLHGYSAPKVFAEIQRNGYWVHPFGRGNLGYRGIAEIDIFEALADATSLVNIDSNRRYIYGFSMGGGGTWSIALRSPDMWAAAAIFAGGVWRENEKIGLAANARNLPIWIWCGEDDFLFPQYKVMMEQLQAAGIKPTTFTTPGLGHNYRMDIQEIGVNWLQQHTRKRPDTFTFRADTDSLATAWGITIERNPVVSAIPEITCRIDGQTVHIDSKGDPSLVFEPGADGMNLTGDIKVVWNGENVYSGTAQVLRLADGKASPFDSSSRRMNPSSRKF